jgi:hypothetical protein
MAVVATVAASIAAANYARTHLKPAPSEIRSEILETLTDLEDESRYLLADLGVLKDIFENADFPNGSVMRLRSGAYLSWADFRRYENLSDGIYRRLRSLNKIGLSLEKRVSRYGDIEAGPSTNMLGEAYSRLERLINAKDLSVDRAWSELQTLTELVLRAISEIRKQLQWPATDA